MKAEKVWKVIEFYDKTLESYGYAATQMSDDQYNESSLCLDILACHCRWMCRHVLTVFKVEYEDLLNSDGGLACHPDTAFNILGKAMRWLGYIQGVINARAFFSCNELRDHSRGDDKEEFKTSTEEHSGSKPDGVEQKAKPPA